MFARSACPRKDTRSVARQPIRWRANSYLLLSEKEELQLHKFALLIAAGNSESSLRGGSFRRARRRATRETLLPPSGGGTRSTEALSPRWPRFARDAARRGRKMRGLTAVWDDVSFPAEDFLFAMRSLSGLSRTRLFRKHICSKRIIASSHPSVFVCNRALSIFAPV